jgi:hypothetical protein
MTTNPPRRMGPPGVSSGYFQRTIVGYTGLGLVTDIGLCPVLRTRPGLPPPQIRLPSTFWVRGIPVPRIGSGAGLTRAFASGLLQAHIAVTPLPSATLRLHQAGSGLCPVAVSNYRTAPFSSRAKARHTTTACSGQRFAPPLMLDIINKKRA